MQTHIENDHAVRITGSSAPRVVDSGALFDFCCTESFHRRCRQEDVVAVSPDGQLIATATSPVSSAAAAATASPRRRDSQQAPTRNCDGEDSQRPEYLLHLWSAETGEQLLCLHGPHSGRIVSVIFTPPLEKRSGGGGDDDDDSHCARYTIVVACLNEIWTWRIDEVPPTIQQQQQQRSQKPLHPLLVGRKLHSPIRLSRTITCLAVSLNGSRVAAGHADGVISLLQRQQQQPRQSSSTPRRRQGSASRSSSFLLPFPVATSIAARPITSDDENSSSAASGRGGGGEQPEQNQSPELQHQQQHQQRSKSTASAASSSAAAAASAADFIIDWSIATHLCGHSDYVCSVAFFPTDSAGSTLLSGSEDRTLRLWNTESAAERGLSPLPMGSGSSSSYVTCVAAAGCLFASGSLDKNVRIWDSVTGQMLATSGSAHKSAVTSLAFAPPAVVPRCSDELLVSTSDGDGSVLVWNCCRAQAKMTLFMRLFQESPQVSSVGSVACFIDSQPALQLQHQQLQDRSSSSNLLLLASSPSRNSSPSRSSSTLSLIMEAAVSRSGSAMTTSSDVFCHQSPQPQHLARSASSATAAGRSVSVATRRSDAGVAASQSNIPQLADNFFIAILVSQRSEDSRGAVRLFNGITGVQRSRPLRPSAVATAKNQQHSPPPLPAPSSSSSSSSLLSDYIYSTTFSPDGRYVASAHADGQPRLWEVATGKEMTFSGGRHRGKVRSVCFSRDAALLVTASEDKTLRLWNVEARCAVQLEVPVRASAAEEQKEQHQISRSSSPAPSSPNSGKNKKNISSSFTTTSTRHSPAGRGSNRQQTQEAEAAAAASSPQPPRHQPTTRIQDLTLNGHQSYVYCAVFSHLVPWVVASCSHDRTVRLWDLKRAVAAAKSGQEEDGGGSSEVLAGHTNDVISVSFCPASFTLASASHDRTVRVWNVEGFMMHAHNEFDTTPASSSSSSSSKCIAVLHGHTSYVNAVCHSPTGTILASASDDKTILIWQRQQQQQQPRSNDTEQLSLLFTLKFRISPAHSAWIYGLSFSPDASVLVSASRDRTVRFWNTGTGAPRSQQPHIFCGAASGRVRSAAFAPDGSAVVSGGADGALRVWGVIPTTEGFAADVVPMPMHSSEEQEEAEAESPATVLAALVSTAAATRCAAIQAAVPVDFVMDFGAQPSSKELGAVVKTSIGHETTTQNKNDDDGDDTTASSFCAIDFHQCAAGTLTMPWRPQFEEHRHRLAVQLRYVVEAEAIHRCIVALHELAVQLLHLQREEGRARAALQLREVEEGAEPVFRLAVGDGRAAAALTWWLEGMERHFRLRQMMRRLMEAETGAREWIWIGYLATAPHTRDRLIAQHDDGTTARVTGTDVTIRRGGRGVVGGGSAAAVPGAPGAGAAPMVLRLRGHTRSVTCGAIAIDGKAIVTGSSFENRMLLWRLSDGRLAADYRLARHSGSRLEDVGFGFKTSFLWTRDEGGAVCGYPIVGRRPQLPKRGETAVILASIQRETAAAAAKDQSGEEKGKEEEAEQEQQQLPPPPFIDLPPLAAGPCSTCGRSYDTAPFEWRCDCGHGELWPVPGQRGSNAVAATAGGAGPSAAAAAAAGTAASPTTTTITPATGSSSPAVIQHQAKQQQQQRRIQVSSREATTCLFCGNDYASSAIYHQRTRCFGCGRFMCASCVAMQEVVLWEHPPTSAKRTSGHEICYDCCARASTSYFSAQQTREQVLRERKEKEQEEEQRQRERAEREAVAKERQRREEEEKRKLRESYSRAGSPAVSPAGSTASSVNSNTLTPSTNKSRGEQRHTSSKQQQQSTPNKKEHSPQFPASTAADGSGLSTPKKKMKHGGDDALYSPGGSTATSRAGSATGSAEGAAVAIAVGEPKSRSPLSPRSQKKKQQEEENQVKLQQLEKTATSEVEAASAQQQQQQQQQAAPLVVQLPLLSHIISLPPSSTPASLQLASLANAVTQLAGFDLSWTLAQAKAEIARAEAALHISSLNSGSERSSGGVSSASDSGEEQGQKSQRRKKEKNMNGSEQQEEDDDDGTDEKRKQEQEQRDPDDGVSSASSSSMPPKLSQLEYEQREQLRRAAADIRTALSSIGYSREDAASTTVAAAIAATLRRIKEHPTFPQSVAVALSSLHSITLAAALVTANRAACRQLFARIALVLVELVRYFNREPQPQHQAKRLRSADINEALQQQTSGSSSGGGGGTNFNARLSALVQEMAGEFNVYAVEDEVVAGLEQTAESCQRAAEDERYKTVLLAKLSNLYHNLSNRERNFEQLHERTGKALAELQSIRERLVATKLQQMDVVVVVAPVDDSTTATAAAAAAAAGTDAASPNSKSSSSRGGGGKSFASLFSASQQYEHATRAVHHLRREQSRAVAAMQSVLEIDAEPQRNGIQQSAVVYSRSTPPMTITSGGMEMAVSRRATIFGNTPVTVKSYQPEYRHLAKSEFQVLRVLHANTAATATATATATVATLSRRENSQDSFSPLSDIERQQLFVNPLCVVDDGCSLVTELLGDSLATRISNGVSPLGTVARFKITLMLATALAELHTLSPAPLYHRDLKPSSVRFLYKAGQESAHAKVANLGFAVTTDATWLYSVRQLLERDRLRQRQVQQQQGAAQEAVVLADQRDDLATLAYAPPEAFFARTEAASFDEGAADCYALGVTLCDLWTRKMSFYDVATSSPKAKQQQQQQHSQSEFLDLDAVVHQKRKGFPPVSVDVLEEEYGVPPLVAGVIHSLCDSDPKRRPCAADVRDGLYHILHDKFSGDVESMLMSRSAVVGMLQHQHQQQQQQQQVPHQPAARKHRDPVPAAVPPPLQQPAAATSSWLSQLAVPDEVKSILRKEMILDQASLALLSEADLKEIGVPLGPRKVLLQMIK